MSIINLLNQIENDEIVLPAIQRDFVWPEDKVFRLLDSIMRGYPIRIRPQRTWVPCPRRTCVGSGRTVCCHDEAIFSLARPRPATWHTITRLIRFTLDGLRHRQSLDRTRAVKPEEDSQPLINRGNFFMSQLAEDAPDPALVNRSQVVFDQESSATPGGPEQLARARR